jgi:hypothetical protein
MNAMNHPRLTIALLSLGLSSALPAMAGPYSDDLSKCLVSSTTVEDKQALVRWIFSAVSLHPGLEGFSALPSQRRMAIDTEAGALFERLLADDCAKEARDAVRYEGDAALGGSFELLGKVASTGLFEDPAVNQGLQAMLEKIDMQRLQEALQPPQP